jgi:hypothetical protein
VAAGTRKLSKKVKMKIHRYSQKDVHNKNFILTSSVLSVPSIEVKCVETQSVQASVSNDIHVTTPAPIASSRSFLPRG